MELQTCLTLKRESIHPIDYHSKILLLGSCFSENIGNKLAYYKFQSVQNPFGILFHPKAIETLITNAVNKKVYTEKDVFLADERWHCFEAHSQLSTPNKEALINNLNAAILQTNKQLKETSHIVITLGTAWVYRFIETDTIITNCHKIPQKKFLKELLSVDEITESLEAIVALIRVVNSTTKIIFTVSPVRHLKDGFIENQQSKAHLIAGIHQLLDSALNGTFYFPSYEIMMDELRDYRFYAADMIHPNPIAIDYIWEKFATAWLSDNAHKTMLEIASIQKGLAHKPFNVEGEQHQQFLKKLSAKKTAIKAQFPHITF